jgi:hypothetical protein
MAPALFAGDRVHAVLGYSFLKYPIFDISRSFFALSVSLLFSASVSE